VKLKEIWRNLYDRYASILGKEEADRLTADIYEATQKLE